VITKSITIRMAEFISTASQDSLSQETIGKATRAILDTLAVTIAGGIEKPVLILDQGLTPSTTDFKCISPWSQKPLSLEDGALLYGMASHVLDYDDVSLLGVCHPSAPILSTLIAATPLASREHDVSGELFCLAFCIGTEIMGRVGQALGFRPYALGFHTTAVLGTLGAAAAAAKLLRLDFARTAHTLAIAASMAAGLRKNFGSMVKPLHVGLAASNGLRAARLAAAGIEGSPEPFENDAFLQAYSGGNTNTWPAEIRFGDPFAVDMPGFSQKLFPCCYMLHKMITATISLREQFGCSLEHVKQALVEVPKGGSAPLIHPRPRTGLNAKFSAPYVIAASLLDGRIDLSSFKDDAVNRSEIQKRLPDIIMVENEVEPIHGTDIDAPVTVTLTLHDGRTLTKTIEHAPGAAANPLTLDQLRSKWIDCLRYGKPESTVAHAATLFDKGIKLQKMTNITPWLISSMSK